MANPTLNKDQLGLANALLERIGIELAGLAGDNPELLFAYRRKIAKMLVYEERSNPMERRKLKAIKRGMQNGLCNLCKESLPEKYTVLDRIAAIDGYTLENTRLLCEKCDRKVQAERSYA
jgi:hypothetical protein